MNRRNPSHFAFRLQAILLGALCLSTQVPAAERPHLNGPTNYIPHGGTRAIAVTPSANPQDLLQCLLGPGVTASNVLMNAAPGASGTFTGGLDIVGIGSGIVLSSGDIVTIVGPNLADDATFDNGYPGDPDLDGLIPGYQTFDAASLEFDFECPTTQVVSFQYVFASEEYNEWVNSPYNDVFGFFLNGTNIAVVPVGCSSAGTPVSINNVNCDNPYAPPGGINCDCYRNNDLTDGGPFFNTEMDGLTQVFYATSTLQPGVNHIKIAVADAGDHILDSNVMIACQSFTCAAPPATGACCFPDSVCVTLAYPDCYNQGGNFYGDYIACVPDPCADPVGACCFPEGECEVEGATGCVANGGAYQGDGTLCDPTLCSSASVGQGARASARQSVTAVPNPAGGEVWIHYSVSTASPVSIEILDASGRLVRRLVSESHSAGEYSTKWDGRDDAGNAVPAGVYLTRLGASGRVTTGRVIRIR